MPGDEWQPKLDTYLDGELPTEVMRELDAHVRSCPSCAAEVLNRLQLKRAVQASAAKRYLPTTEFRERIQKSITIRRRPTFRWGWLTAATVAALLIAGALTFYVGLQKLRREQVFSELADLHVTTLASPTPVDVVSSDRHTVKPWFQGKIPFTFNLPELKDSEFVLVGGRVAYLGQTPGAQLIYQVRKHQISVFIFQDRALSRDLSTDTPVMRKLSFNAKTWSQDGLRYFVVGDAAPEDIQSLSQLLKKAERS